MDLNPDGAGTFNFILQVWRPNWPANVCYSLVDNFTSTAFSVNTNDRVARVTPSPQHQLQFQIGDVVGFYVESNGAMSDNDNGVVLLNNGSHTNELVWFASIDTTAQTSQSGSCPYPVGTTGVLNLSTHAAPVISVAVMTTPCLPSVFSLTSIISSSLPHYDTRTTFTSSMITAKVPGLKSGTISNGLISGVAVAVCCMVVCISAIIIIFAVIVKRHIIYSKEKEVDDTGMAQVYCESISIIV